jgi:hypothetical protein
MSIEQNQNGIRFRLLLAATVFALITGSPSLAPGQVDSQEPEKSVYDLKVHYARLNLMLAESELQLAEQFNRELVESIPPTVPEAGRESILKLRQVSSPAMARLQSNIEMARQQLVLAQAPSVGNTEKIRRRYAEEKIRMAEAVLIDLRERKARGLAVRDLEIRHQELKLELAKLDLQLLDNPENLLALVESQQRQIDALREELIVHDQRITALEIR